MATLLGAIDGKEKRYNVVLKDTSTQREKTLYRGISMEDAVFYVKVIILKPRQTVFIREDKRKKR